MNHINFTLYFDDTGTLLEDASGELTRLPVGPAQLAATVFSGDLPRPQELERAIDVTEDAIMSVPPVHAGTGVLRTSEAILSAMHSMAGPELSMTRSQVEVLFQSLASASLGDPSAAQQLPRQREFAAALLILREVMHHANFERVDFFVPERH